MTHSNKGRGGGGGGGLGPGGWRWGGGRGRGEGKLLSSSVVLWQLVPRHDYLISKHLSCLGHYMPV